MSIFFISLKTKCQQENEEDNEENGGGDSREQDGRDDAEYDAMLISTAGDLLPVLTSIACTGNVPFFPAYLASIIPKLQKRLVSLNVMCDESTHSTFLETSSKCIRSFICYWCTCRNRTKSE